MPPGDAANHDLFVDPCARERLRLASAEAALRRVVERQEALRLSFLPGKTQPLHR